MVLLTLDIVQRKMCTNKGGHRDTYILKRMVRSATRFERPAQHAGHVPPSLERSERQSLLFVIIIVVVDSAFKQSENVAIAVMSTQQIFSDDHFLVRAWIRNS